MKQINKVGVIGAGQMGAGIAQVLITQGFGAVLCDTSHASLEKGAKGIRDRVQRLVEKGASSADDMRQAIAKLELTENLEDLSHCDLIIEAIVENVAVKQQLFIELDRICKKEAIFASNTSSISITKLASVTKRSQNFVGMHFMNPVPVMKLVEVIRGIETSDETHATIIELAKKIGKTPVTANRDFPGFLVNRILVPMINEAIFALMEGLATRDDIDQAMKLGTNQPMGPLELADFVGLDTLLAILRTLHSDIGDDKYRPCPLLVNYVEAGLHGRKSGRGFYNYSS